MTGETSGRHRGQTREEAPGLFHWLSYPELPRQKSLPEESVVCVWEDGMELPRQRRGWAGGSAESLSSSRPPHARAHGLLCPQASHEAGPRLKGKGLPCPRLKGRGRHVRGHVSSHRARQSWMRPVIRLLRKYPKLTLQWATGPRVDTPLVACAQDRAARRVRATREAVGQVPPLMFGSERPPGLRREAGEKLVPLATPAPPQEPPLCAQSRRPLRPPPSHTAVHPSCN